MLWDDFINSEWHDWRGSGRSEDRLDRDSWLLEFMKQNERICALSLPTDEERRELKKLRRLLRDLVRSITSGQPPVPDQVRQLNEWMSGAPVYRQLTLANNGTGFRVSLIPAATGWVQGMADIAASFAETLQQGELSRIRICINPDCKWVYYDETRNRSKQYCDDKACGNLLKVRRFRAKKKQAEAGSSPGKDISP